MVSTKTNEATQRVEKVLDYFVVCEALRNSWQRVEVMCKADTGERLHVLIIIHEERDQRMIKYALLHIDLMVGVDESTMQPPAMLAEHRRRRGKPCKQWRYSTHEQEVAISERSREWWVWQRCLKKSSYQSYCSGQADVAEAVLQGS